MKAVVYSQYGPPEVLRLTELEKPRPKANEVLIKIHTSTVTSGDARLRASDFPPLFWLPARLMFGLCKPKKKILGHELSGVVEEVGKDVTKFQVGDQIFGTTTMLRVGAYAEYVCLPQEWKDGVLQHKPTNMNFQESAALPVGAMTAVFLLEKAGLKPRQKVLVFGASGSVGSYAVQLAVAKGATVTAVCSAKNTDLVLGLGAKHAIDYETTDYSEGTERYDIVFDAVGKSSKAKAKKVLEKGGSFVSVNMITNEKESHLSQIKSLAEQGLLKPFIDKHFTLDQIVEAHKYVDSGRKRGNVIIQITS